MNGLDAFKDMPMAKLDLSAGLMTAVLAPLILSGMSSMNMAEVGIQRYRLYPFLAIVLGIMFSRLVVDLGYHLAGKTFSMMEEMVVASIVYLVALLAIFKGDLRAVGVYFGTSLLTTMAASRAMGCI
jgi:hypothetical protein